MNNLPYRSHLGDLQGFHSQTLTGSGTNQEVLDSQIIPKIRDAYEHAIEYKNENLVLSVAWASLMTHPVVDSYSQSHDFRNEVGEILRIQDFNLQSEAAHAKADYFFAPENRVSLERAQKATSNLMLFYVQSRPWNEVEAYLRQNVYIFAPGIAEQSAGGTESQYSHSPNSLPVVTELPTPPITGPYLQNIF
jgi:hypothetical protein